MKKKSMLSRMRNLERRVKRSCVMAIKAMRRLFVDLLNRQYISFGRDKQKLANWLACQGFPRPRIDAWPNPNEKIDSSVQFFARHVAGFTVATLEHHIWILRPITGARETSVRIDFDIAGNLLSMSTSAQRLLN